MGVFGTLVAMYKESQGRVIVRLMGQLPNLDETAKEELVKGAMDPEGLTGRLIAKMAI